MNSNENSQKDSGVEAARAQDSGGPTSDSQFQDGMKRAAAKQLIEAYYFQLTDGCGDSRCNNEHCASSPAFSQKDKNKNALAAYAIELFKNKASLCENQRSKIARLPDARSPSPGGASEMSLPVTPGPSARESVESKPDDTIQKTPIALSLPQKTLRKSPEAGVCTDERAIKVTPGPSTSRVTGSQSLATTPTTPTGVILSEEKLDEILEKCHNAGSWSLLIKTIGSVYNDPDVLKQSFRKPIELSKETKKAMEEDDDKDIDEKEDKESGETVRSKTFVVQDVSTDECTVDIPSLRRAYEKLLDIEDHPFQSALINALISLSRDVEMDLRYRNPLDKDPNYLNIFIIVMEIPLLHSPEFIERAFPEFCKALGHLPLEGQVRLVKMWSEFSPKRLQAMVEALQQLITVKLINGEERWKRGGHVNEDEHITGPTKVMKILYYASLYGGVKDPPELLEEEKEDAESDEQLQQDWLEAGAMVHEAKEQRQQKNDPLGSELGLSVVDCRRPLVPFEDFINETLNDYINIETDYKNKLDSESGKLSFVDYNFIMTTASKHMSLYMDNRVRMFNERRSSILNTIIHGVPPMPFLRIRVSRDNLIGDALVALEMVALENPSDLKKQLFVEFDGEQGLDEGGVSKEFFQLVIEEIFKVDFGMFTYNEETHQFWFNPTSFENDAQFSLIGVVLGLAIYNSTIVDVHFPPVVYRKLMGKKGVFEDLQDVDPTLANGLQEMLDYTGDDFQDVFMQTFRIGYKDVFGSTLTHDLKEKGEDIPVTQENKQEFVNMYADFLLNKSIEKQFRAFRRGFKMVTNESPLRTLFRPMEVELLICGSEHFDFFALEQATEYDGGFDKTSKTIRYFWEVVHTFEEDQKRKLLQFTTGTDRVPVGGLSKLKLIIARNGPDSERLPTAHTCFNVLLLPDYATKEKLQERLLKAITYSKGFGML